MADPALDQAVRRNGAAADARRQGPPLAGVAGSPLEGSALRRTGMQSVGTILYLVTIGSITAVTVVAFLGIGFFALLQPAKELIAGPLPREVAPELAKTVLPPETIAGAGALSPRPMTTAIAPLPREKAKAQVAAAGISHNASPVASAAMTPQMPAASPVGPAPAAIAAPSDARLPSAEIAALLARGDAVLRTGDVASARLFYERAADAGSGQGALRAGAAFDPAFLASIGLRSVPGDPAQAQWWYGRARQLGATGGATK